MGASNRLHQDGPQQQKQEVIIYLEEEREREKKTYARKTNKRT